MEDYKHLLTDDGEPRFIFAKILKNYEMFGDMGILNKKPRSATIVALEDTEFLLISEKFYRKFIEETE